MLKNIKSLILNTLALKAVKFVKFSFMLGSSYMFFSATNIVAPMVGIFGGLSYAFNFLVIQILSKLLFFGGSISIGYYIPQFFASLYWLTESKYLRLLVPALCLVLFLLHPVGGQAWLYAMLWFIPMVISFFGFDRIFLRALGSTFVAHAVGSVLWIYTVPMVTPQWIALIPVALVERMLFATGMVAVYYVVRYYFSILSKSLTMNGVQIFSSPARPELVEGCERD